MQLLIPYSDADEVDAPPAGSLSIFFDSEDNELKVKTSGGTIVGVTSNAVAVLITP